MYKFTDLFMSRELCVLVLMEFLLFLPGTFPQLPYRSSCSPELPQWPLCIVHAFFETGNLCFLEQMFKVIQTAAVSKCGHADRQSNRGNGA